MNAIASIPDIIWAGVVGGLIAMVSALLSILLTNVYALKRLRIEQTHDAELQFKRLRYDLETQLYRDFWRMLCTFYGESFFRFSWKPTDADAQSKSAALQEAGKKFFDAIRDNRPFYPEEMWLELKAFSEECDSLAHTQSTIQNLPATNPSYEKLGEMVQASQAKLRAHLTKIEKIIRERLADFYAARS